jgi:hypothetical protein
MQARFYRGALAVGRKWHLFRDTISRLRRPPSFRLKGLNHD